MSRIFYALLIAPFALFACSSKTEEKQAPQSEVENGKVTNDYPDLVLTFENGTQRSTKDLTGNNMFILFQPECDHCQEEAIQIEQRLKEFKDYTLYFISSGSMEQIIGFAKSFNLYDRANVKFALTSTEGVLDHYGPIQTPSVYIYSQGKLKQSFNGQTEIENILSAL